MLLIAPSHESVENVRMAMFQRVRLGKVRSRTAMLHVKIASAMSGLYCGWVSMSPHSCVPIWVVT